MICDGKRCNIATRWRAQYDAAWLLVDAMLHTASNDVGVIAGSFVPMSHWMYGISGWMALDENGDRMPQFYDIWGLYEDPITHECLFRKFGSCDAQALEVVWDGADLECYAGMTRLGK